MVSKMSVHGPRMALNEHHVLGRSPWQSCTGRRETGCGGAGERSGGRQRRVSGGRARAGPGPPSPCACSACLCIQLFSCARYFGAKSGGYIDMPAGNSWLRRRDGLSVDETEKWCLFVFWKTWFRHGTCMARFQPSSPSICDFGHGSRPCAPSPGLDTGRCCGRCCGRGMALASGSVEIRLGAFWPWWSRCSVDIDGSPVDARSALGRRARPAHGAAG